MTNHQAQNPKQVKCSISNSKRHNLDETTAKAKKPTSKGDIPLEFKIENWDLFGI